MYFSSFLRGLQIYQFLLEGESPTLTIFQSAKFKQTNRIYSNLKLVNQSICNQYQQLFLSKQENSQTRTFDCPWFDKARNIVVSNNHVDFLHDQKVKKKILR